MEQWKPVTEFMKLYEVSNTGRVRNLRGKVLSIHKINSGYMKVSFTVNNKRFNRLVHRLVAAEFCDKPKNAKEVNHIDEDKENNHSKNLEWCTSSQNKQHSIKSGRYHKLFTTKNSLGKKHLPNNHSKYHNVTWDKNRGKWSATVRVNKKNIFWKRFATEEEAALHVNWILDKLALTDRPRNQIKGVLDEI